MIASYSTKGEPLLKIRTFDVSLRTAYAQAKETARAQGEIPLLTAGSLQTEDRAGGKFVYRYRYDATGKRAMTLLEDNSPEAVRLLESLA